MPHPERTAPAIDVGALLDSGAWTRYQKAVTLLAALAVIFDGFDLQIFGFAIPSIMGEWHLARAAFAPIAALGLAGMAVAAPFAGYCGDRFGRRLTLIGCVLVFGLATIATAFCNNLVTLGFLRIIAGAGVGGALPNASALTAEFAPLRRRALAVTLTIVCVPLGGMLAGLVASRVLPAFGWRTLYEIGGAAPLLLVILLLLALPESPGFLMRHIPKKRDELISLLARLGRPVDAEATMVNRLDGKTEPVALGSLLRSLLTPPLRRESLGLWLAFLASTMATYLVFGWLPSLLTAHGLSIATASLGLALYNFAGVAGVLICVTIVTAMGSRRPLMWAAAGAAASALALVFVPIVPSGEQTLLMLVIGLAGFFVNSVQSILFALASHVYPAKMRASGVAWAAAVGRSGAVLSSLSGAAIIQAGSSAFAGALAIAMSVALIGLAIVRNHFPGRNTMGPI